jgi:hypothetical protein
LSKEALGNTEVVAEPTVTVGSGETATFDSIDAAMNQTAPKAERAKPEPKAKAEKAPAKETDKPKAKAKEEAEDDGEEAEAEETDDSEGEEAAKPAQGAAKAKIYKVKSGDKDVEISSDTAFKVPVDGKKEDVPLQELIDNYSGKVNYDRKFSELDRDKKTFQTEKQGLHEFANKLVAKAGENPERAFDFAAHMAGKDPVEFKTAILNDQIRMLTPYFELDENGRKEFLRETVLRWREEKLSLTEAEEKEKSAADASKAELSQALDKYGISQGDYDDVKAFAKESLKKEPTTADVLEAHRTKMFVEIVREDLPHLWQHPKRDQILNDQVEYALKNPGYSKADMAADLKAVFGAEDKGRLKTLSRKVEKSTEASDDERPAPKSKAKNPEAVLFDDL